jgi:hypothetical protein
VEDVLPVPLGASLALQGAEESLHGGKVQEDQRVPDCGLLGGLGLLGTGHIGGQVTPEEGQLGERILLVAHGEPCGIDPLVVARSSPPNCPDSVVAWWREEK